MKPNLGCEIGIGPRLLEKVANPVSDTLPPAHGASGFARITI